MYIAELRDKVSSRLKEANDTKFLFLVMKDSQVQEEDSSSGLMSDEVPQERWCRYTLHQALLLT